MITIETSQRLEFSAFSADIFFELNVPQSDIGYSLPNFAWMVHFHRTFATYCCLLILLFFKKETLLHF